MAGDGQPELRRSTRKRKEISYKDLEGAAKDNITDASVVEPPSKPPSKKHSIKSVTTKEDYEPSSPSPEPERRSNPASLGNKEGRLTSIVGTDESLRDVLLKRLENWKNVLIKVPEELLDYTIGWGVCVGTWNGKGGDRQKFEIIQLLSPLGFILMFRDEAFKPSQKLMQLTIGPKASPKTLELRPCDVLRLCIFFKDLSDFSKLFPETKGTYYQCRSTDMGSRFSPSTSYPRLSSNSIYSYIRPSQL
jgi:hypothetical protein